MEPQLKWKKKLFSNKFEIFQSEMPVGELKNKSWTRTSIGELNSRKYMFSSKGFFKQEAEITDINNNNVIGKISFSSWRSKAIITYNNQEYTWQSENLFGNKWSISQGDEAIVRFHKYNFSGDIEFYKMDEFMILTGLFIRNFFWERDE
jgi:hypothetical protein